MSYIVSFRNDALENTNRIWSIQLLCRNKVLISLVLRDLRVHDDEQDPDACCSAPAKFSKIARRFPHPRGLDETRPTSAGPCFGVLAHRKAF